MKKASLFYLALITFLILSTSHLHAQKDQIPLDFTLDQHSERQLIKIGMITASKPAKLKFGTYNSDNRNGAATAKDENNKDLLFSFDLIHSSGSKASIEGATNIENIDIASDSKLKDDASIYITTTIDKDELWVLLMTKTPETKEYSLKNIFLTNGTDEITFKHVIGEPSGKSEATAPKGIIAYINGNAIGAFQYYSGGSFSYKKFIWISDTVDEQLQLITASVFSAMLELGDYFIDTEFVD